MKLRLLFIATALLSGSMAAQQIPSPTQAGNGPNPAFSALKMGPGDLLEISVYRVPELTIKTRIDEQGAVNLPLVGKMQFSGLTVSEAEEQLARTLIERGLVLKPQVTIFVDEYATQGVTVLGEVNQPGTYPLFGPHRLFDAISAAGGLTPRASSTITLIHHGDTAHPEHLNYAAIKADLGMDVALEPGDTIVIDKAPVIYVVGDVNKPGAFLMENNSELTVLRAIALAQGATHTAALSKASIVRKTPDGMVQIQLRLDRIMHGNASDFALRADDIVFLPTSKMKVSAKQGIEAALQATVGMAEFGRF